MASDLTIDAVAPASKGSRGLAASMLAQAWRTTEFKIGLVVFLALMFISIFGPDILGLSATRFDVAGRFLPPLPLEGSRWPHIFGTDQLGRDLFVRSFIGLRNALMIGAASVIGMFLVGSAVGMIAGYWSGWVSLILMRLTDAQMAIPVIILAITILGVSRPTPEVDHSRSRPCRVAGLRADRAKRHGLREAQGICARRADLGRYRIPAFFSCTSRRIFCRRSPSLRYSTLRA